MEKLLNFNEFVSHVNETKENESFDNLILEGFDSSILQKMVSNSRNGIGKKFFDALSKMGIASSEITNLDMQVIPVSDASKYAQQHPNQILIYYSNSEKGNPYAGINAMRDESIIQSGIVLAVVKGKFYQGLSYDRYASKSGKAQYNIIPDGGQDSIGVDKQRGMYGSGLNTLKKMADVTDIVYAIDPASVASSTDKRLARKESKEGATSFKNNKEFKEANQKRYDDILSTRAVNSDIDGIVQKAIDELTEQIKEGLAKKLKGKYGDDLIIGESPKGREVKMTDATYLMNNILTVFGRYTSALTDAIKSKETHGILDTYHDESAKRYAKEIRDYVNKIPSLNYAF